MKKIEKLDYEEALNDMICELADIGDIIKELYPNVDPRGLSISEFVAAALFQKVTVALS